MEKIDDNIWKMMCEMWDKFPERGHNQKTGFDGGRQAKRALPCGFLI